MATLACGLASSRCQNVPCRIGLGIQMVWAHARATSGSGHHAVRDAVRAVERTKPCIAAQVISLSLDVG
jgi:hypothetical protein